jgi:hypothetical protein
MILDLTRPAGATQDPALLRGFLNALVGQRCLKADLAYGNQLMLHVGGPVAYVHPKLNDEKKGSWILCSVASGWRIFVADTAAVIESDCFPDGWSDPRYSELLLRGGPTRNASGEQIEGAAKPLSGKVIVAARPILFPAPLGKSVGLSVDFGEGSSVVIVPNTEPDDDPLPDWELYSPTGGCLQVGPGLKWEYVQADLPEKK